MVLFPDSNLRNPITQIAEFSPDELAKAARRTKDKVMTIAEIESQFESEWVLIEDPQTNEGLEMLGGTVRCHSKNRDEVYRKAVELRPKRFAMLYTGTIPKDTAVVL